MRQGSAEQNSDLGGSASSTSTPKGTPANGNGSASRSRQSNTATPGRDALRRLVLDPRSPLRSNNFSKLQTPDVYASSPLASNDYSATSFDSSATSTWSSDLSVSEQSLFYAIDSPKFDNAQKAFLGKILNIILRNLDHHENPDELQEAVDTMVATGLRNNSSPINIQDLKVNFSNLNEKNTFCTFANILLKELPADNDFINLLVFIARVHDMAITIMPIQAIPFNLPGNDNLDAEDEPIITPPPLAQKQSNFFNYAAFTAIGLVVGAATTYCIINKCEISEMATKLFEMGSSAVTKYLAEPIGNMFSGKG